MSFTREEARNLCTKPELELVVASDGRALEELSLARVQSKLERARALRDKYRDLKRSQRLEARGKPSPRRRAPRSEGAVRTGRKAEIFETVAARFEARASELQKEIDEGKRLAKPPGSAAAKRKPRAADPPPGQSKKGHRRSRRRTVQQALEAAPTEDTEALEELQLPKGTRSAQRRLARKPPRKKPAKKTAKKTAKKKTAKKKTAKTAAKKKTTKTAAKKKTTKTAAKKKTTKKTAKTAAKKKTTKTAAKKKTTKRKAAKKKGIAAKGTKRRGGSKAKKTKVAPVSPAKRNRVAAHSMRHMSAGKAAGRRNQARRDRR